MLLGKRVLGVAGAAAEAAKAGPGAGVTAVLLGKRAMGAPKEQPASAKVPEPAPVKLVAASGNKVAKGAARAKGKPERAVGFSEGEVESMLTDDPNQWSVIVDAESKRPEGPRPAVAALVLSVAELATENPVPAPILAELQKLAAVKG